MKNKLREPMNHRNFIWSGVLLGILSLFFVYIFPPTDTFGSILTGLIIILDYCCLMMCLWAALRINLLGAHQHEINVGSAIIPSFFGAIFAVAPIIVGGVLVYHLFTLTVSTLVMLFAFGLLISFTSEMMIFCINQQHCLQKQALSRFLHNQEMTIGEVAAIALLPEKKVRRALGYQEKVPASAAREWLENVKGIRCPPAVKALA